MTISLLQLNINGDNYWDALIPFLTSHNFDVLHLQEITGKDTISGIIHSRRDVFVELQKVLAHKYNSEIVISGHFSSSPSSYMGNAIFYKKDFSLLKKQTLTLHQQGKPFDSDTNSFEDAGRELLHLTLNIQGKQISFLTTHGAWAKTAKEEPHQTQQGEILFKYLQTVPHPFVFSGDLNLSPDQPLIQKINTLARNLTIENKITNTLNPRTHYAKQLFPPGIAVDYIFVSPDLKVKEFHVLEEDLSDHLGLTAEIEI